MNVDVERFQNQLMVVLICNIMYRNQQKIFQIKFSVFKVNQPLYTRVTRIENFSKLPINGHNKSLDMQNHRN